MVNTKPIIPALLFYILSWTWGIALTLVGAIAVFCIKSYYAATHKDFTIKKHGYCYYIQTPGRWGGLNLGMFFITDSRDNAATKWHEHGHAIQNCFWGILTPFVITIPSALRYWHRTLAYDRKGIPAPEPYDAAWFEHDATCTGEKYRQYLEKSV